MKAPAVLFIILFFIFSFECLKCPQPSYADFTIVVYPDSQNEVDSSPTNVPIWQVQNEWVVNNIPARNITAVLGVGDVANTPSAAAYTTATVSGYDLIDNSGLPYLTLVGNHDYDNLPERATGLYDDFFGPTRFAGKSWYLGGHPAGSNANLAIKFDVGERKYLAVGLEFFPRASAVAWAQSVIDANPDREVIIVTHAYLTKEGTLYQDGDNYGPAVYGLTQDYSGQELWDNFIKTNSRIFLVISGHDICSPNNTHLLTSGTNGNTVSQLFTNYQCYPNGGDGYILLLKVKPTQRVIEVTPYSTNLAANDPNYAPYVVPYSPLAPTISSVSAVHPPQSDVLLSGMVNDNGAATTVLFEYGLTTGYGNSEVGGIVTAGSGSSEVSAYINGLSAGATYHARAIAINIAGTVFSNDISFTMPETPSQWPLTMACTGTGRGIINSIPTGIACDGSCITELNDSSTVNFIAIPDNFSVFSGWGGDCSGLNCSIVMNSSKSVIALFTAAPLVMVGTTAYQTLQEALNGTFSDATIKSLAVEFIGDLTLNRNISISLEGGHAGNYLDYAGLTSVKGSLAIENGSIAINNLLLK